MNDDRTNRVPGDEDAALSAGLDAIAAADAPHAVPAAGRDALIAAAVATRAPWETPVGEALTALGALGRTAAELDQLLAQLGDDEWASPTVTAYGSVREVLVHLVGVERYALGQLGVTPPIDAPRREDHAPSTLAAAKDVASLGGPELRKVWKAAVDRVIRALAATPPDTPLSLHHLPLGPHGMAVIRTFELWTHADDIRRATGRPVSSLDAERLALMSGALVDSLPGGLVLEGVTRTGRTAELVITGPGGSRRLVPMQLDQEPGVPDVTVTVSVVELCRLAANRIDVGDLRLEVEGDGSLVEPLLVAAGAFAMD